MSLVLDDDLLDLLAKFANNRMPEVWMMQMVLKLVLENQGLRQSLRVVNKLENNNAEHAEEVGKAQMKSAAIAPFEFYKQHIQNPFGLMQNSYVQKESLDPLKKDVP